MPVVQVVQLVRRIVLEAYRRRRRPLGVLLCDAFLCDAAHVDRLAPPQLDDAAACAVLVRDDGPPDLVVWPVALNHQVARVDLHDLAACAFRVQRQDDGAVVAVAFAVAVARVQQILDAARGEGDEAEAVADKFVGEHGGVVEDLYDVDGNGGDLGQHDPPQRVGRLKVEVLHDELRALVVGLHMTALAL